MCHCEELYSLKGKSETIAYEGSSSEIETLVKEANGETEGQKETRKKIERIEDVIKVFEQGGDVSDWEDITSDFLNLEFTDEDRRI